MAVSREIQEFIKSKILDECKKQKTFTAFSIARAIGINPVTAKKYLEKLVEEGKIKIYKKEKWISGKEAVFYSI